ncbi:zinc finger, CCHC-type containing protein, partial [Tanacetum coccineum]
IIDSIDLNGATRNTTRLCLFCFSLRDQAINWLDRLPAGSISTWDDLTTRFLTQFFPPGRTAKLRKDILMFQQHQDESLYDAWTRFKDLLQKVPHHGLDLWLQVQIFYDHVDYTTQMAINYAADASLEQELESMECQVESLMMNEVLLEYEFNSKPEGQNKAQRAHYIKIEKITSFPTHTPTVTPETLKPIMVHRVSMISKIEPTNYRTPHHYLNSNLKMPLLHSFEENKLEYKDEDAVEIKMMGTGMD